MRVATVSFLILACVSCLIGMSLGSDILEGDYDLRPTHVHLLLIGWVSNAIFGLYYRSCLQTRSAKLIWAHFVFAFAATLFMPAGFLLIESESMSWLIWIGVSAAFLSIGMFLVNILLLEKRARHFSKFD